MQLKQLLSDDEAVSPVIGVILMVAITVILAAVIATFVLGLGEQVSSTSPQASFTFEYNDNDGELSVTHDGGDTIKGSELYFRGQINDNGNGNSIAASSTWADISNGNAGSGGTEIGTMSASQSGESAVVSGDFVEFPIGSNSQLRIAFEGASSDSSATLGTWEGPDA